MEQVYKMGRSRTYLMHKRVLARLTPPQNQCVRCGGNFEVGDLVESRRTNGKRKLYHRKCWCDLFIEVKD